MKLTEEVKNKIIEILDSDYFKNSLYVDANDKELDKTKRDELGQFYTPAKVCITMLEMFKTDTFKNQTILDPCCGSGNLLIAMLIAGADIDKLYGNEYDEEVIPTCRNRIMEAFKILKGRYPTEEEFRPWQIHQGNALQVRCLTEFGEEYNNNYNPEYIDDLEYAQSYEHDEEQTFLGKATVHHIPKISWAEENIKAQERLEKKQQLEKKKLQESSSNNEQQYEAIKLF